MSASLSISTRSSTAHVVRTPANAVASALAQVFSKEVIHGFESQHSFNLFAEQWSALSKPMRSLPSNESLKRSNTS